MIELLALGLAGAGLLLSSFSKNSTFGVYSVTLSDEKHSTFGVYSVTLSDEKRNIIETITIKDTKEVKK